MVKYNKIFASDAVRWIEYVGLSRYLSAVTLGM